MEGPASKPRRPRLGDVLEPEALATYLRRRQGTLVPYCDRIAVPNGFGEERFELVRWRRACVGSGRDRGDHARPRIDSA